MTTASRTAEEVFAHHGQSLGAESLDDIIYDYSADALLIVQSKIYRGPNGARQVFTQLLNDVPQAKWSLSTVFADTVLYLEWQAHSAKSRIDDGIDTFVFRDGKIVIQTVRYTVTPE
jgi:hypothetical protein